MNLRINEDRGCRRCVRYYFEGEVVLSAELSGSNRLLAEGVMKTNDFRGRRGEMVMLNLLEGEGVAEHTYIGLGKRKQYTTEGFRSVFFESLKGRKGEITVLLPEVPEEGMAGAAAEVLSYLNYGFHRYMSDKKEAEEIVIDLRLNEDRCEEVREGLILGRAVCITRDLINEPANVIYPESLGEEVRKLGRRYGFHVEVKDEEEIEALNMGAYLAVARAAVKRPKLIVMRYMGDPENSGRVTGLIGKGVTYDTGGLSLKSTEGMTGMKNDMGGAATIIGAMTAIAEMKLKRNITAVIPACENAIGGDAYRPGDIIESMSGRTIEVLNTDTEGRMTLADAITYAIREEGATEIIDTATLTGAVIVALGLEATGVFTNCQSMYEGFEEASGIYGELVWRLPSFERYRELIRSDIADLKNTGGRWGGAVAAAKFLEEFTEGLPWMHLDIAGTSFSEREEEYYSKGATGKTVRALYSYFKGGKN